MKLGKLLFFCLWLPQIHAQHDTLRLQAKMLYGSPGYTDFSPLVTFKHSPQRSFWEQARRPLTGIPDSWEHYYREEIWFQSDQFAYQNYRAGNIDDNRFRALMQTWQFDTLQGYSRDWIRCSASMIYHLSEKGQIQYALDTDGDYDFSDQELRTPVAGFHPAMIDSLLEEAPWIDYQLWFDGQLIEDSIPLLVTRGVSGKHGAYLKYFMPLYGQVNYGPDTLVINSMRPDFKSFKVSNLKTLNPRRERYLWHRQERGHRISLHDGDYIIEDFDRGKMQLILRRESGYRQQNKAEIEK